MRGGVGWGGVDRPGLAGWLVKDKRPAVSYTGHCHNVIIKDKDFTDHSYHLFYPQTSCAASESRSLLRGLTTMVAAAFSLSQWPTSCHILCFYRKKGGILNIS